MTPSIQYTKAGHLIWKVLHNPTADLLLIELRNEQLREVSFTCLQCSDNKIRWEVQLDEKWWATASATAGHMLYATTFQADAQVPAVKELLALHLDDGHTAWRKEGLSLEQADENYVWAKDLSDEAASPVLLEASNGSAATASVQPKRGPEVLLPAVHSKESEHFATLEQFIEQQLQVTPHHSIQYMEVSDRIVIAFHQKEGKQLKQQLGVWDLSGNLLHHETVDHELSGLNASSFIVAGQYLIYIVDKTLLKGYKL